MLIKNNTYKKLGLLFCGGVIALLTMTESCNKSYENSLKSFEDYNDTAGAVASKKVLYLIVDGANGSVVQRMNPTNLSALTNDGVFAWQSISGFDPRDSSLANSWANTMTGAVSSKTIGTSGIISDNNFAAYPSIITRIKQDSSINRRVVSYAAMPDFNSYLAQDADVKQTFDGDDDKVTEALISELGNENASIVVGEFGGVYSAGLTNSFDTASVVYKQSITKFDAQLGKIISALKARENYTKERWLIVVTSTANLTKASPLAGDATAFGNPRLNTFTIFANSDFQSKYIPKPADTRGNVVWNTSALRFKGNGSTGNRAQVPDYQDLYEPSYGKSITIEAKIKLNATSSGGYYYTYPPFLSKVSARSGSSPGWSFFRSGNNTILFVGFNSAKIEMTAGGPNDGKWHTLAGVISWNTSLNQITGKIFLDGALASTTVSGTISNPTVNAPITTSPLTIGYWPSFNGADGFSDIDMYMRDVRIWNTALPDATIAAYSCYPSELLPSTMPYLSNLVGDFRIDEINNTNNVLRDYSSYGKNGTYSVGGSIATQTWASFSEVSNAVCPAPDNNYYKGIINAVDIPIQIYRWLGVPITSSWNLNGLFWPFNSKASVTNTNS